MNRRLLALAALAPVVYLYGCTSTDAPATGPRVRRTTYAASYETQYLNADGTVTIRRSRARQALRSGYWKGDGVTGPGSIVIDIGDQQARFYKGVQLVGVSPISTGNTSNPTPVGQFRVIQKSRNHRSSLYGDYVDASGNVVVQNVDVGRDRRPAGTIFRGAPMPYFIRFYGGAGMHAGFLPGFPDSHGCVRLPDDMAERFFDAARIGTPVRVLP